MKSLLAPTIFLVSLIISQTSANIRRRRQGFVFPDEEPQGESCRTPINQPGTCIPLDRCEALRRSNDFDFLRNSICGFDRDTPRVCCPSTNRPATENPFIRNTTPSRPTTVRTEPDTITTVQPRPRITFEPSIPQPVTDSPTTGRPAIIPQDCGISTVPIPKVVGGSPADLAQWPWMAAVYLSNSGLRRGTDCGGALVTIRHVITAAHCVTDNRGNQLRPSDFTVRLGEHILNNDTDGASPIDVPIARIVRHENFQRRVFKNDIAILTLERDVTFNRFVRPICLPYVFRNVALAGRQPWVAGWGTTAFEGQFNAHLSHVQLPVRTNEECHRAFRRERVPITREYLCAGDGKGDKDSCQGDSGGPLMLPFSDLRFYLVGIVSFGKRCAEIGYPGVYTRVTMYLDWIERNLT